mmetsp:Transcript_4887/g.10786  ORF Transcript_4887/g.10786 Transcript_4887/m.10786 type:complete len:99 (+) Transcript_4887:126-422(+)
MGYSISKIDQEKIFKGPPLRRGGYDNVESRSSSFVPAFLLDVHLHCVLPMALAYPLPPLSSILSRSSSDRIHLCKVSKVVKLMLNAMGPLTQFMETPL